MNCPKCFKLAPPRARQCACGMLLAWPAPPVTKPRPMPAMIDQNLKQLGFVRYKDETPAEFAERCRRYTLDKVQHDRELQSRRHRTKGRAA